mgnify:FL=1
MNENFVNYEEKKSLPKLSYFQGGIDKQYTDKYNRNKRKHLAVRIWNRFEVKTYMGTYFNPNNESFTKDKNSELYIDKTGLLEYLNRVICTNANCISVSHARRFGKSHAAGMIDAYYSCGCDSADQRAQIPGGVIRI